MYRCLFTWGWKGDSYDEVPAAEPHGSYDAEWDEGKHGESEFPDSYDDEWADGVDGSEWDPADDWDGWWDELEPKPESCWGPSLF